MFKHIQTISAVFVVLLLVLAGFKLTVKTAQQNYHYIGRVVTRSEDTISIETKEGINSTDEQDWDDTSGLLEGEAPNQDSLNGFTVGDWVEIGSLGEPENFVVIAKVKSNQKAVITNIYGDPRFLKEPGLPWLENYTMTYENQPDCSSCKGSTCEAESTLVSIEGSDEAKEVELQPGEKYMSKALTLEFNSGETSASKCIEDPAVGPQPVSDFTIELYRPESWIRYKPELYQVSVNVVTLDDSSYATVRGTFPNPCFKVSWGAVEDKGSKLVADAKVFSKKDTICIQLLTPFARIYKLSELADGQYEFIFKLWGEKIKSKSFEVPSPVDWNEIKILPSPVTSSTVQFNLGEFGVPFDSFSLRIFDLLGRKVFEKSYSDYKATLSISNMSNGLYLYSVKINYEGNTARSPVKKFLILR